jgi:hypothetical protein
MSLLGLWSGTIPSIPMMLAYSGFIWGVTYLMLVGCAVALWFEREHRGPLPMPADFGGEHHRLAA